MPGRRKQFAQADKATAKAARKIEAAIVALMDKIATLPKVPMDYVEEQIEQEIYLRNRAVFRLLSF